MIELTVVGSAEAAAYFRRKPEQIVAKLKAGMTRAMIDLSAYVKTEKLHGQVLHQRSGRLAGSIHHRVTEEGKDIVGHVGTNVEYAAIHEYGGMTPAHEILPRKATVLAFTIGGKKVFARRVQHPGSKMPERSFLRSALNDKRDEIIAELKRAVAGL